MRKILSAILATAVAVAASGCCSVLSREAAFLDGVKQYSIESGLLSEYEKYVDADPSIKPETKTIRKNTASGLKALIAEEEKALKASQ